MFYEQQEIIDLFEASMAKKKKEKKKWKTYLFTTEINVENVLSDRDLDILHTEWQKFVKERLSETDAGYIVNEGNVFALVLHDEKKDLLGDLKGSQVAIKERGFLTTSVRELTDNEALFLLTMPSK